MRFAEFIRLDEAPVIGGAPLSPMGGGMGAGPIPAPGSPPMGSGMSGGMGGMGGPPTMGGAPPMGGGMPGQQQQPQQPQKIKTKDVWNLLEKLLSGQSVDDTGKEGSANQEPQDNPNILRT